MRRCHAMHLLLRPFALQVEWWVDLRGKGRDLARRLARAAHVPLARLRLTKPCAFVPLQVHTLARLPVLDPNAANRHLGASLATTPYSLADGEMLIA